MRDIRILGLAMLLVAARIPLALAGSGLFYEDAPFHYSDSAPSDPLALLVKQMKAGEVEMDRSSDKAFLKDLLGKLDVPIDSQVMVYSKTSFQNSRIRPSQPRALYFSDEYYIGWVQGGDIEVISIDPNLGPIFYVLEIPKHPEHKPILFRPMECMNCHGGSRTEGIPGMLVRSVKPTNEGFPILAAGISQTDHASPIADRWGGWYVTGENAGDRHMGNLLYEKSEPGSATVVKDHGVLKSLDQVINTQPYLSNKSDIVALMVMEHQITVHNIITQSSYNVRRWLHYDQIMTRESPTEPGTVREATRRMMGTQADRLLKVMLFHDEVELDGWGIEGDETFQEAFQVNSKKSEDDRSLKDFELLSRLFKHRLNYMIYSKSFEALPEIFKDVFYHKLHAILTGQSETKETYGYLKENERSRILQILKETDSGFAQHLK